MGEPLEAISAEDAAPGLYEIVTATGSRYRVLVEADMPRPAETVVVVALLLRQPGAEPPHPEWEETGTSSLRNDGEWFPLVAFRAKVGGPALFFWLRPERIADPDYGVTIRETTTVQSIARIGGAASASPLVEGDAV